MRVSEFIEQANRTVSKEELFRLLADTANEMGFDRLAYGVLRNNLSQPLPEHHAPAVALNYPDDWVDHYFAHGFQTIDPIVRYTPVMSTPYPWAQLNRRFDLDKDENRVMNEAREAGLRTGVSVPLHGPWGAVNVVSFVSSSDNIDCTSRLGHLHAIAAQFSVAYTSEAREGSVLIPHLSEREKECLRWSAQGKSSWDTGVILGISEFTVNFHIKKAMQKLETNNRIVAVVKAIRFGLIRI
jgi:DNA-binding CsgD family transcriptional regulator